MSFKANIGIILHLHSFKNIALPHKARYALRTTIYQGKAHKVIGMPFNIIETQTKHKKNVSNEGEIQEASFLSKRFNIEYQEEQIQLNDCCEFRLTLESFPQLKDEDLYIEFTLVENVSCYFREQINSKVELKEADSYRFKLQNIATGIFRYCEGQFAKGFVSSFSFTLFAMVTDYRFHPYTPRSKTDSPKEKARERVENIDQLMKWSEKYLKNCDNGSRYFYQLYVKSLRYNSFCLQSEVNGSMRKSKGQIYPKVPTGEGGELVTVNDKQFFDYVVSYFPEKISEELIKMQIHRINQQNFYFVQNFGNSMSKGALDMKMLKEKYRNQRRDLFGERVFRSLVFGKAPKDKDHNNKIANKMRKKKKIHELKIIDEHLFMKKQNQHYAFIEVNLPHNLKTKEYQNGSIDQVLRELSQLRNSQLKEQIAYDQRNMLVVLVHGFQASSYDMQVIRRELLKKLPVAMFLNATCNELDTNGDIQMMGKKLADQIKLYINRFIDNQEEVIINLVGHSMGGIIARAALPFLQTFQKQLGFYFSLSSPHLGYINGVDLKIKAGLWFMRKTNKVLSLDQLSMQDKQSMKQTFLYKLSSTGHLRNFKKVILLSSSEDSYVPWHSARIEFYDGSGSGSKLQKQMVQNILGDQIVHRIDIHFDIQTTKDLDSFIGRAAHINLLTQESILKLVNQAVPNLFDYKQL